MKKKIYLAASLMMAVVAFSACGNDDDLDASIFDTSVPTVDPNASTAPFDQWLYDNFVVPYNTEIQYTAEVSADTSGIQTVAAAGILHQVPLL